MDFISQDRRCIEDTGSGAGYCHKGSARRCVIIEGKPEEAEGFDSFHWVWQANLFFLSRLAHELFIDGFSFPLFCRQSCSRLSPYNVF